MTASSSTGRDRAPRAGRLTRALERQSYAAFPLVLAVVLFVACVIRQPAFIAPANWASTLSVLAPFVLVAIAQAIPVISGHGGMDLSVGPFAGFMTVLIAFVLVPHGISAAPVLIPVVVVVGLAAGAVNGLLVGYVRLQPIIATLGTSLIFGGAATQISSGPGGTVPAWLVGLNGSYGPVPGVLVLFACITAGWLLFTRTAFLRNLRAVGGDERAAYSAGIDVGIVRVGAYALAGMFTALAGMMLAGLLQAGDGTVGSVYTVASITAVALGGIALSGGRGGILGAALGGGVLFLIQNLLTVLQVSIFALNIVNGVVLICALGLNAVMAVLRRRRVVERREREAHLGLPPQTAQSPSTVTV